jgi:surfactin synthase thioesterase subunit
MTVTSPWLVRCGGAGDPRLRLLCLPWAGSGASVFRTWRLPAALGAEVWAVQWPGHENRWREPLARDLTELVDPLSRAVRPLLDRPLVLLGHSMGALTGFELARTLQSLGTGPELLAVSAYRAPHRPPWRPPASDLPLPSLLDRLDELSEGSRSVVRDRSLVVALEPVFRADFAVCERYSYHGGDVLAMPVLALGAVDDPEVRVDEVAAWSELTTGPTELRFFKGGHLFLLDHAQAVLRLLGQAVAARVAAALPADGRR